MAEKRVERRLTAILAADVAGYSRLMSVSEEGTLAELKRHRRELFDPKIGEHCGRIVKTTGDGMLVEFASIVEAVRCAVDIQRQMTERNADVPPDRRIEFRVGLNVGDIIFDEHDIYGDGVNIAARLETLAEPGGICASRAVRDQVRDKLDLSFGDMGEQRVKNIARPVRAHRILLGAKAAAPSHAAAVLAPAARPPPRKPSIAVLPFANMSGEAEQEYFAEGITEDIITNLSRNRAFFVISRSTSFTYKGLAIDVSRVARELGVRYLLEGSIRRAGNRIRITAQLIEAETRHHLWAERYDRELADVFDAQDEISQSINGAIALAIMSAEIREAQRKDASQLDAWACIMRAHWHIRRFTESAIKESKRLLAEAIVLDPDNSIAFGNLAFAAIFESLFGWGDGPAASLATCGAAARQALNLDEGDATAQTLLAIYELFSGEHEEARRRLRRALDLDPNSPFAHGYLGTAYAFGGDHAAALLQLDQAIRLSPCDPLLILWYVGKAWASLTAERFEEAIEFAIEAGKVNPEFPDIYALLASANGHLGKAAAADTALGGLSRRMPALTASDERLNRPFARAVDRDRFLEGLRKAGMPA